MSKTEINKKIAEITDKIVREFKPEKIILFGSYAWGKPHKDSDIDLFIIKNTTSSRKLARKISGSIYPRFFSLDLLVITPNKLKEKIRIGDFFLEKILNSGQILYEKR